MGLALVGGVGAKPTGFLVLFGFFSLNLFLLPLLLGFLAGALGPLKVDEDEVMEDTVTVDDTSPVGWKFAKLGASPVRFACNMV